MPTSGAGVYTVPAGINPVVAGTVIQDTWANPTLSDVAQGITDRLDRSGRGSMLAALKLFDGTAPLPGLTFANETTSGLYRASAGVVGFSILATEVWRASAAQFSTVLGAVGAPAYSFTGDLNTGMWSPGADIIAWSVGGVEAARLTASGFTFPAVQIFVAALGAVGAPSYTFTGDLNTGMWSPGADQLAWSTAGVQRASVGATGQWALAAPSVGNTLTVAQFAGSATAIITSSANGGGQINWQLENTSNTASSDARHVIQVGGAVAGDPFTLYSIPGFVAWSVGADNSDVDRFKISASSALGTSDRFIIDAAGNVTIPAPTGGNTLTLSQLTGGQSSIFAESSLSGSVVQVTISNSSNTASSTAQLVVSVAGATAADAMTVYTVVGATNFSTGIDNSDSDTFKISSNATPGSGSFLAVTTDGRVYGNALHNNAGSLTGTVNQYLASANATALTLTTVANVTAVGAGDCIFIRLGNVVVVFGEGSADVTAAANTLTTVGVSLPIASNIANTADAYGAGWSANNFTLFRLQGNVASDRADLSWRAQTSGAGLVFGFFFIYVIK